MATKGPKEEKIAWYQAADCCLTPAGLQKPTVTLDVDVTGGGTGLTVTATGAHACGIADYGIGVKVKGPGDTEWWNIREINVAPNDNVWKWGPGEADQLPVPSLTEVFVYVVAFSTCLTMGEDSAHILLL